MAIKEWLRKNCRMATRPRVAMPHLTLTDIDTEEQSFFDACVEFIGTDLVPPGWDSSDWDTYSQFLRSYYRTEDKGKIIRSMHSETGKVPVWDRKTKQVKLLQVV